MRYILHLMNVGLGFSQLEDPILAANEAVGQALMELKKAPASLALIFTSVELAHPLTLRAANNLLGEIPILGCSSLGIMTNAGVFRHGFAVLVISLHEQTFFNVAAVKNIDRNNSLLSGKELGDKLLFGFKNIPRSLSIILSDKLITEGTRLINGLQESLGLSFPLIGAAASDNFENHKTYQYLNKEILSESCSGILFGGRFNFGFGIKHGWKALGKMRCVTASSGHVIQEIDGLPAVKLYEEYFAKNTRQLAKELRRISIYYPLGIYLPGEKEYLLRNIVSIREDGALVTQGDIPENSKIRLMISTEDSRLTAVVNACEEAKKNLGSQKAKFLLLFDSGARFFILGRQNDLELCVIKEVFGEKTPLIGIYTNGEQAPLKSINYLGKTYFHNQSIIIVAIGEQ
ncbi:MAG: FIST N-terminal domain-containing protein [Candidatus Omnitrophica bacterium]|nr:FIST C-terminal domain-containing protein [Candidatus Omnitrophota bacterium]MDD3274706.1 FIST N-terminal domain-containing protein [Candidatus Omnitrophota bacterium]